MSKNCFRLRKWKDDGSLQTIAVNPSLCSAPVIRKTKSKIKPGLSAHLFWSGCQTAGVSTHQSISSYEDSGASSPQVHSSDNLWLWSNNVGSIHVSEPATISTLQN